jgi:hypothetical protein
LIEFGRFLRRFIPVLFLAALSPSTASCAAAMDLKDFTSDGCSLFPDGSLKDRAKWCVCCLEHDISYWQGGTKDERRKADERLRECVVERTGDKALAETMYLGVRAGGHPAFPMWYRWAYGRPYGRGYRPLTDDERSQARRKLDYYKGKHPEGYCREKHPALRPGEKGDK